MRDEEESFGEIILLNNKYGYQIDISNPKIRSLYDRFKKWKNIPDWCPLSDAERFEFEGYILQKYKGETNDERNKNQV